MYLLTKIHFSIFFSNGTVLEGQKDQSEYERESLFAQARGPNPGGGENNLDPVLTFIFRYILCRFINFSN